MRFVHTADWQLGMTRRFLAPRSGSAGGSGEAQARFAEARLDAVRALGRVADAAGAAFVLVCGDVFEHNLVGPDVVGRACEALRSFSTPVLLLPGNHDPADAASVLRREDFVRRCPERVRVLDTPGVHEVAPGIEVVAAPWASKRPLTDLVAEALRPLGPAPPGTVRVLAGHGGLDALPYDTGDPARIAAAPLREALADGRLHYAALGDRHSSWAHPAEPRLRYSGAPEVTAFDEVDPGNVLVVDVDGGGCAVRTEHVGRWRFRRHAAALDTEADAEALDRWLDAVAGKERTALRLGLVGSPALRAQARLEAVLDAHRPIFAALEVDASRSSLTVRPDDADLGALEVSGFAAAAAAELHADGSAAAHDALALLHRMVLAR